MSGENGKWRSRIVERRTMRVGDLAINKYNPKRHPAQQQTRLQAVLDKFGIVEDLLVYRSERNDGALTLFDGHARQNLDDNQEWGIAITDLTDAEVDELVFYFDPLAGMSLHDEAKMTALMQDLGDVDGVLGEMLRELGTDAGVIPVGDDAWADSLGSLPDGDKAPFQQMTFTLHDSQVEQIATALGTAKAMGAFVDSPNENSNGNALARICETFNTEHGES